MPLHVYLHGHTLRAQVAVTGTATPRAEGTSPPGTETQEGFMVRILREVRVRTVSSQQRSEIAEIIHQ